MSNEFDIKASVMRTLDEAATAGRIGCATEEEAAQFLREGLKQVERDHGLNVVPFRAKRSVTSNEGGEA